MFDPTDWMWRADDGRHYSSLSQKTVKANSSDLAAWLDRKACAPTPWPKDSQGNQTDAALLEVLRAYGLTVSRPTLSEVKANSKRSVDEQAETERLKYITPGNGQAMTYQQKVAEAQALKAATNPKASDYPMLSSEVGITAGTMAEVADIVLAAFVQWQQIGATIEAIRLGAKRDIDAAEDEAIARAIVEAIVWPSEQVQP